MAAKTTQAVDHIKLEVRKPFFFSKKKKILNMLCLFHCGWYFTHNIRPLNHSVYINSCDVFPFPRMWRQRSYSRIKLSRVTFNFPTLKNGSTWLSKTMSIKNAHKRSCKANLQPRKAKVGKYYSRDHFGSVKAPRLPTFILILFFFSTLFIAGITADLDL